jgi:hypothetical protein
MHVWKYHNENVQLMYANKNDRRRTKIMSHLQACIDLEIKDSRNTVHISKE